MVERSLSMREVPGSIPGASTKFYNFLREINFDDLKIAKNCYFQIFFIFKHSSFMSKKLISRKICVTEIFREIEVISYLRIFS